MTLDVIEGDCLAVLPTLGARYHAVVTDPPYHLTQTMPNWSAYKPQPWNAKKVNGGGKTNEARAGFMNQAWDGGDVAFRPETWRAVYDVMLPGAYLVAFASTRGYHRMVCAIEDAGFVIHPMLGWIFGSGFPKATNLSKMIDRQAGAEREVIGTYSDNNRKCAKHQNTHAAWDGNAVVSVTAPATPEAQHWDGWAYGLQSLKPALEPICLAQRPVERGGMVANVLAYGCGALNIAASRVAGPGVLRSTGNGQRERLDGYGMQGGVIGGSELGRWPANVIHDGSAEAEAAFAAFGESKSTGHFPATQTQHDASSYSVAAGKIAPERIMDTGTASRFFYSAKADAGDRADSRHPTVKPVDLMRYLVRLVTPPGGRVLDPFAGSGTTGEACMLLGLDCTMIERDPQHVADIRHRIRRWSGLDAPLFAEAAD